MLGQVKHLLYCSSKDPLDPELNAPELLKMELINIYYVAIFFQGVST